MQSQRKAISCEIAILLHIATATTTMTTTMTSGARTERKRKRYDAVDARLRSLASHSCDIAGGLGGVGGAHAIILTTC